MSLSDNGFEDYLALRRFEPASYDLAERIIAAARVRTRSPRMSLMEWVQALLSAAFPQPGFALAAMLTLGIAIGFGLPGLGHAARDTSILAFMEDDEAVL